MKNLNIPTFNNIKLNSFRPLCINELGQNAIRTYNFPPFIDASCRREPDFENPFPSISALCRHGQFAPHLKPNDIVIYMTVQGQYAPHKENHHRVVAILQVEQVYTTHSLGQADYTKIQVKTPSNCMVPNNPPYTFDKTAGNFETTTEFKKFMQRPALEQQVIGQRRIKHWDKNYLQKSQQWTCFVRTKTLYKNLVDPVPILRKDFEIIFGKLPNTRTPNKISKARFISLGQLIGLNITLQ